jgi:hypothetical protein
MAAEACQHKRIAPQTCSRVPDAWSAAGFHADGTCQRLISTAPIAQPVGEGTRQEIDANRPRGARARLLKLQATSRQRQVEAGAGWAAQRLKTEPLAQFRQPRTRRPGIHQQANRVCADRVRGLEHPASLHPGGSPQHRQRV